MKNSLILLFLFAGGCNFSLIGEKAVDKFSKIVEEKVKQTASPYIDVQGPPPEKIIDWPEILAVGLTVGAGMFHRYLNNRKIMGKLNGTTNS